MTRKNRAVAPIIATLLMIAISVVGGILVFVFQQSMLTETEIPQQSKDQISIIGYDLRDVTTTANLQDHTGTALPAITTLTKAGGMSVGDFGIIYVENPADTSFVIRSIEVAGASYVYVGDTSDASITGTYPGAGKFTVCTVAGCNLETSYTNGIATVPGNYAHASIIFEVDPQAGFYKDGKTNIFVSTDNMGMAMLNGKVGKQKGS